MENYAVILVILSVIIILSTLAERIKVAAPIVLIIAGIAIGFLPSMPEIQIDSEIIFLLFLPPLLYDAAFKIPAKDFRENLYIISSLAFSLVFVTTAGIAVIAHIFIPGMSWPLAFILGAILASTDAVAALSITKGLKLSRTTTTILEGESLLNDASALVAYRFALAALSGTAFVLWKASLAFLILLAGGFLIGLVIARILAIVLRAIRSNAIAVLSLILLAPFVTYLVAEHFHSSGVIAVVTLGFNLSRLSAERFPDKIKMQSETVWDTISFLLNGLIFILIGLELPIVIRELDSSQLWVYAGYGLLLTITALLLRTLSVFANRRKLHKAFEKQKYAPVRRAIPESILLSFQDSMVISWSGMRGIISLAIAIGLPNRLEDGTVFPMKSAILYITTVVVLITIVGQGLLLPLIARPKDGGRVPKTKSFSSV
ncbi:Na+/H+ antiporter [Filimonas effusa]|uniref:Na+/H+ antiporter n=1 Tax=Filimonas effusa TaxID=2508721 RepID=A0A4Q1D9H6_9BACT|nr:Na+/H+ antiporter [Filimonas effusa]RXK86032.1 Na+/H+ antiporter [Filimonas effusa]